MSGTVVSRLFLYNLLIFFYLVEFPKISGYDSPEDCLSFDVRELEEYLSKLNLKNVPTIDMMIGESKCPITALPFGAFKSDWARLLLLQRAQPNEPIFKQKLARLFRILVVAYFRVEEPFDNIEKDSSATNNFAEFNLSIGSTTPLTSTEEFSSSKDSTSKEATLTTEFGTLENSELTTEINMTKGLTLTEQLSIVEGGNFNDSKLTTLTMEFSSSEGSTSKEATLTTKLGTLEESKLTTKFHKTKGLTLTEQLSIVGGGNLNDSKLTTLTTEFGTLEESELTTEFHMTNGLTLTKELLMAGGGNFNDSKLTTLTTEFSSSEGDTSKEATLTTKLGTLEESKLTTEFHTSKGLTFTKELLMTGGGNFNDSKLTTLTTEFSILEDTNSINDSIPTSVNATISSNHQKSMTKIVRNEQPTKSTFIPEVNVTTIDAKRDFERKKGRGDSSIFQDSSNIVSSDEDILNEEKNIKFIANINFFEFENTTSSSKMFNAEDTTERTRTNNIYQIFRTTDIPSNQIKRPPVFRNSPSSNDFWKYIVISQNVTLATPTASRSNFISEPEDTNDVDGSLQKFKKRGSLNTSVEKNFRWFYNLGQKDKQISYVPATRRGYSIKCGRRTGGK